MGHFWFSLESLSRGPSARTKKSSCAANCWIFSCFYVITMLLLLFVLLWTACASCMARTFIVLLWTRTLFVAMQKIRIKSWLEAGKTGIQRVGKKFQSFPTQQVFRLIRNQQMRAIICRRSSLEMEELRNNTACKCVRQCTTVWSTRDEDLTEWCNRVGYEIRH